MLCSRPRFAPARRGRISLTRDFWTRADDTGSTTDVCYSLGESLMMFLAEGDAAGTLEPSIGRREVLSQIGITVYPR